MVQTISFVPLLTLVSYSMNISFQYLINKIVKLSKINDIIK